jgi:hypothetical protein
MKHSVSVHSGEYCQLCKSNNWCGRQCAHAPEITRNMIVPRNNDVPFDRVAYQKAYMAEYHKKRRAKDKDKLTRNVLKTTGFP